VLGGGWQHWRRKGKADDSALRKRQRDGDARMMWPALMVEGRGGRPREFPLAMVELLVLRKKEGRR
jgi:hypothetical protein